MNPLKFYFIKEIKAILDIGEGQGGFIKCLNEFFNFSLSIILEYDISWSKVAKIRNPTVEIIRGNAISLPIKRGIVYHFSSNVRTY